LAGGGGWHATARQKKQIVIAGLDPAIHADCRQEEVDAFARKLSARGRKLSVDHRVKPGGDEVLRVTMLAICGHS
jgi:hypothetical protein